MKEGTHREKHVSAISGALIIIAIAIVLLMELEHDLIPFISFEDPTGNIQKLLVALIAIAYTWIILYFIGKLFERLTTPRVGSHAQARSMWNVISYAIWILILSAILMSLVGEVSSLILYVGLIGAGLIIVFQKPLLNVAAWGLITYRRIYRIGDRISLGDVKGYVFDIRPMQTELREFGEWMRGDTFTGRIITLPNGMIFDRPVFNYTKDFPFVWDEIVNLVTYESDIAIAKKYMLESATEVVGELMQDNYQKYRKKLEIRELEQLLLKKPELRMELADSGVNIFVLYFCSVDLRRKIKAEITERIWKKFMDDPRVGIAYPHMHLIGHLDK